MTADICDDEVTLFTRLRSLFAADPLIDEIGLVFGIEEADVTVENAFVLEEHKLGVAFGAGPQLFKQATTRFYELNPLLAAHKSDSNAAQNGSGVSAELKTQLIESTRAILLISADFYTAWNTRKEFVCRGWLDAVEEMRFCDLVFTLHPKSIDTWAYRRWLATRLCSSLCGDDLNAFYERQIEVCSVLAEQKARNYHAWSFRHWIVSRFPHESLENELERMQVWCESHITDHSGWNHRQHVVNVSLRRQKAESADPMETEAYVRQLLLSEYALLSRIMASYPIHEALWCHRRFVVQLLLQELCDKEHDSVQLHPFVSELDARVKSSNCSATSATLDTESIGILLSTGWKSIAESFAANELQVLAIVKEIELAWCCGHRYARRFALWCLDRLRLFFVVDVPSSSSSLSALECLGTTLRARLRTDDSLLEDLWANQQSM